MALRNQPYLPLYVNDFMSDEKLRKCSPSSYGVYIMLMCLMHKSDEYGVILLKQKYKQNSNFASTFACSFACQLARDFPFSVEEIADALQELLDEGVIQIEGDRLFQKRMVKDGKVSEIRSSAGRKGGQKTQKTIKKAVSGDAKFAPDFASDFAKAKVEANSEIENINENNNESNKKERKDEGTKSSVARKKYGEYKNVLLTDEQYKKLTEEFPRDYLVRIDRLSEYMQSTGKVYKDHLATIRSWARREGAQKPPSQRPTTPPKPDSERIRKLTEKLYD